jgi:peptide/nickel transport system substrate-binding protein
VLLATFAAGALVLGACAGDDSDSDSSDTAPAGEETTAAPGDETTAPEDTEAPAETTEAPSEEPSGGSVTYAAEQEFTSYNNITADQVLFANTLVLNAIQPGPFLSMPDLTYELFTDMMESAEVVSEDPQVVEYVIKDVAVWDDGEPIDCDDFYLSWMAQSGQSGNRKAADGSDELDADGNPVPVFNAAGTFGYEDIESVECSDDGYTVTTTYSKQFADWKALFNGSIIPAHIVEGDAGIEDVTAELTPEELIAVADSWNSGFTADNFDPTRMLSGLWYKLESFTPGQNLILVRNENYYGTPGNLDEVIFQQVPDAAAQPQALQNGDVQVISPQPTPDLLAQLEAIDGVTVTVNQGPTFEHYDFNQANPLLADPNVRKAFALCIDRQAIVDTLIKPLNPEATVLNNRMFMPDSPYYEDTSGGAGERDVAAAKALLEESGFTLNADGVYEKDGQTLTLRLGRRDPNPRRQQTNQLTAQQCAEAGFELTDDASENFNAERLPASDYDVALFAWVATPAWSSNTSIYIPPDEGGNQNWNNYVNADLVGMFQEANVNFDEASRAAQMNEIDAQLWTDMATLPLFQFQEMYAHSDTVANVVYNGPTGPTWNVNEWELVG